MLIDLLLVGQVDMVLLDYPVAERSRGVLVCFHGILYGLTRVAHLLQIVDRI